MNNLILLVKIATAMYQAWKINDKDVMVELDTITTEIPKTKESMVSEDKKVEKKLRDLIVWIKDQPHDSKIIESMLRTKIADIVILSPELTDSLEVLFTKFDITEDSKEFIYQTIKDLRDYTATTKFNLKFKNLVRPYLFDNDYDLSKDDWIKLGELIDTKLNGISGDIDRAIMEEGSSGEPSNIGEYIDQLKIETSPEGVLKTGLTGLNQALFPDCGFRYGRMYLINALTNRGKSFGLAHLLESFAVYNKPVLRDKSKIPMIFFCSAEDSLGLIFKRMYELIVIGKTGKKPDWTEQTTDDIVATIVDAFKENGWTFYFCRVDPTNDNIIELKQRVRNLELKGYEIKVAAYDYIAMMGLEGISGDTRSDKLQILARVARNFFIARGSMFITPHQLNPKAKEFLRENDDDSEIYFAKEVGGHSMTEGSTKITNETDVEITFHVAKLSSGNCYFTLYVGKQRGEGAPEKDRFCFYPLDPELGLVHDINLPKSTFRRSLQTQSEAMGGGNDFDFI